MTKIILLLLLFSVLILACDSSEGSDATENNTTDLISSEEETTDKPKTVATARMEEIRNILIGDWIEDSLEFKRNYNMPPPPVQNTRIRYQEDGHVYIPDVLLTKENWDTWEISNDSTLLIHKRQGNGTLVFKIDEINENVVYYRLQWGENERKIKLLRIK